MNYSTLTDDAFLALQRMKRDLHAVSAVVSDLGSVYDRAVLKLIHRNAAAGAARAFSAEGVQRDAAWKHIVLLIDELLRHRLQFRSLADRAELARLQAFVRENADAFEMPYLRALANDRVSFGLEAYYGSNRSQQRSSATDARGALGRRVSSALDR
jgi:hypothetical protein